MTTTENPARDEYFDLLLTEFQKYFECAIQKEPEQEERILSITYDTNVALQKRVEELEEALKSIIPMAIMGAEKAASNSRPEERHGHLDWLMAIIQKAQSLLTVNKQP